MGYSSLIGTEYAAAEPAGRDVATLGPGDSSDTGSDMAGIDDSDDGDLGLPVDVAMRDDMPRPSIGSETLSGSASDAAGTGERRSAGLDAGEREGADIGVDRVFSLDANDQDASAADDMSEDVLDDDEDPDLAFVDAAQAGDPLEDEDEPADEDVDDDGAAEGERTAGEDDGIPGAQPRQAPSSVNQQP